MQLPFWSTCRERAESEPISYAKEFHTFVNNNAPEGFEHKLNRARPFLLTSFLAWPMFWMYRGLDWSSQRHSDQLTRYINRTYLRAKMIQIVLITAGIVAATADPTLPAFLTDIKHIFVKDPDYHHIEKLSEVTFGS